MNLHMHTMFSLLDSTIRPDKLVERVKELGQTALAVTDHGNTYAHVLTHKLCKENGIKFIYGVEGYVCDDVNIKSKDSKRYHLVLLCKNEQGRLNLNKLLTKAKIEHFYSVPRFDFELLSEHQEGLIILSACMGGELSRHISQGSYDKAKEKALAYKRVFGNDYYIEVQSHQDPEQQAINRELVKLAKECDVQWVATSDAHYLAQEDQELHSIFVQISQEREAGETYSDCFVQSEEDVRRILSGHLSPEDIDIAIANTTEIALKCNASIPLSPPQIPHVTVPKGYTSEAGYLKHLCNEGWKKRGFGKLSKAAQKEYRERLYYEMNAITRMGFAGYYLLVHSYVNVATRRGIARGSGGGSLVAYLIGTIDIDPVKYGLYFERFIDVGQLELIESGQLKPEEIKIPDFDSDFGSADRENVVQYIIDTYGKDRVASLGQFQYIWDRTAIKDIGRVLGVPFEETNAITKALADESLQDALESGSLSRWEKQYPKLFQYAKQLAGLPKSFGKHPCGKVVALKELDYYCPMSAKDGEMLLDLDMNDAESLGLVKVDALALRTLDVIYDILEMIGKGYDYINPQHLDFTDENVLQQFRDGNTTCIFQFESKGMVSVLTKMKPTSLDDLAVANALFRPGSIKHIDSYINRKHGTEEYEFLHPDLEPILKSTFGIIIFQEQLIEIGRLAGLRNPDLIRKATGKKNPKLMAQVEPELRKGLYARGWGEGQVDTLWDTMVEFSKYSFNKSHSYAYTILAYVMAYLKYYHPIEFVCATLNSYAEKKDEAPKCVEEAKRLGVEIVVSPYEHPSSLCIIRDDKIVYGTKLIKKCNEQNALDLQLLPTSYSSFVDLLVDIAEKTSISSDQLRTYITLNAFRRFGQNGKLLDVWSEFSSGKNRYDKKHTSKTKQKRLPLLREYEASIPDRAIHPQEQIEAERESLGFIISTYCQASPGHVIIVQIENKFTPRVSAYFLQKGIERTYKVDKKQFYDEYGNSRMSVGDILHIKRVISKPKWKKVANGFEMLAETEEYISSFSILKK